MTLVAFHNLDEKVLRSAVHSALRSWHKVGGTEEELLSFLLLVQEEQANQLDYSPASLRLAASNILQKAIQTLERENGDGMDILRMRFQDDMSIDDVAEKMIISVHTVSHKQREAIEQLASLLWAREKNAWEEKSQRILRRLPLPTTSKLFGVDKQLATLTEEILKPEESWITAVTGIGGIGKTSLAQAVARDVGQRFQFENVIWVYLDPGSMAPHFASMGALRDYLTAEISSQLWPENFMDITPPQRLSKVRHALKNQRTLVVIDNVESAKDVEGLMHCLNDWSNPSKFLLTSRVRPQGAYTISLDQLPLAAAAELVHYYLKQQNRDGAATLSGVDMEAIYERTGGNPLALKLVVSLLDALPIATVLETVLTVDIEEVEVVYRRIYWQSWQTISEAARTLLLIMVIVSKDGASLDYLQKIWEQEAHTLQAAITELRYRSLLDVSSDLYQRRYTIHPLTKSFLQTDIIHWPTDSDGGTEETS